MTRADRIQRTQRIIARRSQIRSVRGVDTVAAHKFHKLGPFTGHHSRCACCMNPRRRGELTMQERRLAGAESDGRREYSESP